MNLRKKNRIMIISKKEERRDQLKSRTTEKQQNDRQVNARKRISRAMIMRRERRIQTTEEKSEVTESSIAAFGEPNVSPQEG